ncbi:hypothetical protein FF100_06125 [Methylobacterium terricola]|uniref:Uncharacterized protein n=1 Tax=Methylobacterium terricola TaxID=2583531 RepID=A0A5C4LKV9_9HYPH|nr:hypothetical protein [Methylobacterium terricola]TNC15136.1 hypothetical protein FF100_06125 [Methylobacterium terricola]
MAFWLRAGLVIGAIYYLSPLRLGEIPARGAPPPAAHGSTPLAVTHPAPTNPAPATLAELAGPMLAALPESLRARVAETAAAEAGRALGTGLRAAAAEAARPPSRDALASLTSRDTLTPHDRQPAWRGVPEREAP